MEKTKYSSYNHQGPTGQGLANKQDQGKLGSCQAQSQHYITTPVY